MADIVFLGAGGIAIVAAEIARSAGLQIVGFLDDSSDRHGTQFCEAPILGGFGRLAHIDPIVSAAAVAFGNCRGRIKVAHRVREQGFSLPCLIHPSAVISPSASIGEGSIIMAGVIVNAGARVGKNTILNTAASIDHECSIGDGVHIAPGVRLSGLVTVGDASWVGIGTIIRESVNIGSDVLIGAGSLVLKDIPDGVVAYGSPARVIRDNWALTTASAAPGKYSALAAM